MAKSMVSGKPLSMMLQFAMPLLLGNLLQQTYNIIDAAIVGQILGDKALAGVGASSCKETLVSIVLCVVVLDEVSYITLFLPESTCE